MIEVYFKIVSPTGPMGYGVVGAGTFESSARVRIRCSTCGAKMFFFIVKPSVGGEYYKGIENRFALDHTHHP